MNYWDNTEFMEGKLSRLPVVSIVVAK
jgi:hypothetical protein